MTDLQHDPMPILPRRTVVLSQREAEILDAISHGKSYAEIGKEHFVSADTVKTHAGRMFRKLGAKDRVTAVAAAFRAGVLK